MGRRSPRFDAWLAQRYPLIRQEVTSAGGVAAADNLCVDVTDVARLLNARPAVPPGHLGVVLGVLAYVDFLVGMVKPRRTLFLALDGVVPDALLHNERCKRFSNLSASGQERRLNFDMNSITTGTKFMHALDKHISFFMRWKMSEDPNWQVPVVVFSGSRVVGDAKMKILQHIREQKAVPAFGMLRHCVYCMAPEISLLALATHEPNFYILSERDLVDGRGTQSTAPRPSDFVILHLGILRDYWDLEYSTIQPDFQVDIERVIDDFVFLCLLFGNDALPGVPTLDVLEGGLQQLLTVYKHVLRSSKNYIIQGGQLQNKQLEGVLRAMSELDPERIQSRYAAWQFGVEQSRAAPGGQSRPLDPKVARRLADLPMENWYTCWKDSYYSEKLGIKRGNYEARTRVVQDYVEGLHWLWHYYTVSTKSWCWNYPHNYAPPLTDIVVLDGLQPRPLSFAMGQPLTNLEYLLCVLPKLSAQLLPECFQVLVTNDDSPVAALYPGEYAVDTEGAWCEDDHVVLLPHFDVDMLVDHFRMADLELLDVGGGEAIIEKDTPGEILILKFVEGMKDMAFCKSTLPSHFSDVAEPNSLAFLRRPSPHSSAGGFERAGSLSCMPHLHAREGSPSLREPFKFNGRLEWTAGGGQETFVVRIDNEDSAIDFQHPRPAAGSVFRLLKEQAVFVGWPFPQKAHVQAVSDEWQYVSPSNPMYQTDDKQHKHDASWVEMAYLQQRGIRTGPCDLLLHLQLDGSEQTEIHPAQMAMIQLQSGCWQSVLEFCAPQIDSGVVKTVVMEKVEVSGGMAQNCPQLENAQEDLLRRALNSRIGVKDSNLKGSPMDKDKQPHPVSPTPESFDSGATRNSLHAHSPGARVLEPGSKGCDFSHLTEPVRLAAFNNHAGMDRVPAESEGSLGAGPCPMDSTGGEAVRSQPPWAAGSNTGSLLSDDALPGRCSDDNVAKGPDHSDACNYKSTSHLGSSDGQMQDSRGDGENGTNSATVPEHAGCSLVGGGVVNSQGDSTSMQPSAVEGGSQVSGGHLSEDEAVLAYSKDTADKEANGFPKVSAACSVDALVPAEAQAGVALDFAQSQQDEGEFSRGVHSGCGDDRAWETASADTGFVDAVSQVSGDGSRAGEREGPAIVEEAAHGENSTSSGTAGTGGGNRQQKSAVVKLLEALPYPFMKPFFWGSADEGASAGSANRLEVRGPMGHADSSKDGLATAVEEPECADSSLVSHCDAGSSTVPGDDALDRHHSEEAAVSGDNGEEAPESRNAFSADGKDRSRVSGLPGRETRCKDNNTDGGTSEAEHCVGVDEVYGSTKDIIEPTAATEQTTTPAVGHTIHEVAGTVQVPGVKGSEHGSPSPRDASNTEARNSHFGAEDEHEALRDSMAGDAPGNGQSLEDPEEGWGVCRRAEGSMLGGPAIGDTPEHTATHIGDSVCASSDDVLCSSSQTPAGDLFKTAARCTSDSDELGGPSSLSDMPVSENDDCSVGQFAGGHDDDNGVCQMAGASSKERPHVGDRKEPALQEAVDAASGSEALSLVAEGGVCYSSSQTPVSTGEVPQAPGISRGAAVDQVSHSLLDVSVVQGDACLDDQPAGLPVEDSGPCEGPDTSEMERSAASSHEHDPDEAADVVGGADVVYFVSMAGVCHHSLQVPISAEEVLGAQDGGNAAAIGIGASASLPDRSASEDGRSDNQPARQAEEGTSLCEGGDALAMQQQGVELASSSYADFLVTTSGVCHSFSNVHGVETGSNAGSVNPGTPSCLSDVSPLQAGPDREPASGLKGREHSGGISCRTELADQEPRAQYYEQRLGFTGQEDASLEASASTSAGSAERQGADSNLLLANRRLSEPDGLARGAIPCQERGKDGPTIPASEDDIEEIPPLSLVHVLDSDMDTNTESVRSSVGSQISGDMKPVHCPREVLGAPSHASCDDASCDAREGYPQVTEGAAWPVPHIVAPTLEGPKDADADPRADDVPEPENSTRGNTTQSDKGIHTQTHIGPTGQDAHSSGTVKHEAATVPLEKGQQDGSEGQEPSSKPRRLQFVDGSALAEELCVSIQALVRTLGNVWAQEGMGDRANVGLGLNIVQARISPTTVEATDMEISEDVANILRQYKIRHSWVFHMTERDPFNTTFLMQEVFPNTGSFARMRRLQSAALWLCQNKAKRGYVRAKGLHQTRCRQTGAVASFRVGDCVVCPRACGDILAHSRGVVVSVQEGACEVRFEGQKNTQLVSNTALIKTTGLRQAGVLANHAVHDFPSNVLPLRRVPRPGQDSLGLGSSGRGRPDSGPYAAMASPSHLSGSDTTSNMAGASDRGSRHVLAGVASEYRPAGPHPEQPQNHTESFSPAESENGLRRGTASGKRPWCEPKTPQGASMASSSNGRLRAGWGVPAPSPVPPIGLPAPGVYALSHPPGTALSGAQGPHPSGVPPVTGPCSTPPTSHTARPGSDSPAGSWK